ncbi:hypothetical protein ATANTOWER_022100, partial [Ataeniobius toweri]|nr:hypothetical protein [Ataeniobius toweri]
CQLNWTQSRLSGHQINDFLRLIVFHSPPQFTVSTCLQTPLCAAGIPCKENEGA